MLENDKFIAWANENIYVIVGHTDDGHEAVDGKCPVYPGLTCDQHKAAASDMANAQDGYPKVPQKSGVPNSWMILPNGEVKEIEPVSQSVVSKLIEIMDEAQKSVGPRLSLKDADRYRKAFEEGDALLAKKDWRGAFQSYLKADKKKSPVSISAKFKSKIEELDKAIAEQFESLKADQKAVKALLSQISAQSSLGYLPVKASIEAWLKEQLK